MHNYDDAIGSLPWATRAGQGQDAERSSALVMILPHMEQQPLYNALNFANFRTRPLGPFDPGTCRTRRPSGRRSTRTSARRIRTG